MDGSDIPPQPSQEEKPLRFDEEELTTQSKLQEAVPREEPKPPPEASGAKADKPSTEADEAGSAPTVPEPQLDQVQTKPVDKVQDKPTLATVSETVEDCTKATPAQPPVTEKNSLLSLLGKDSDSQLLVIGE